MSLRLRAVLIAGLSLVLLWGAAAAWMMRGVQDKLDRTLDGRLAMSARMVSGLLERSVLAPGAPAAALQDAIRIDGSEGIACEIRTLRGEVLARSTSGPDSLFALATPGYSTREVQGMQWRVYVLQARGYQITTADRVDQRHVLTREFLYAAGVPFLIALLGGLAALWLGIGRGLAPLDALRRQLGARHADDSQPIDIARPPQELRPVLDAMNGLLARLAQALASQRAFTDAAAHELRTPLTVIDTHLQVLRISEGPQALASLASAEEGVSRLRRTLEQMMALARTEAPASHGDACTSVHDTVRSLLARMDAQAGQRLQLQLHGDDAATPLPRSLLESAARNLVDNALRYSPQASRVEVSLQCLPHGRQCLLSVADRGPGLSAQQASQIGQRFWRGDQGRHRRNGSGLGISIVRAIAQRFRGRLECRPREGGGMVAELRFPLEAPAVQEERPEPVHRPLSAGAMAGAGAGI